MRKLNLLMLNYEFPPIGGGAAHAHLCLLNEYARNTELAIDVLTSAPDPGFHKETFSENITIYKVGVHKKSLHFWRRTEVIEWLVKAQFHYRRLLRENRHDLAHAFFGFPTGWLCYRSADKLPYIISLRGSDVPGENPRLALEYKILKPIFRAIWKKAVGLVACSEGLKDRALRFLPSASIEVIPNGVELDRFYPAKVHRAQTGVLNLLTVGRLSATKRVEMLIDAVDILHKAGRPVRFAIVGGGAMADEMKRAVSQRNLGDIVDVAGRVDAENVPEVYRRNDIYISATMQEGMSNAMLEAMASGLPIITTQCEGVEELVADNGIVVEAATAEAIAQAVMKLTDDRQRYEKMSACARSRAERFTWKSAAEEYISLYSTLLNAVQKQP
ncbi:MAG: glycosyltransferase family 4 protein [Planctomycetota bacterium]|jgi:glycosyltransferase involved in cell wall biosynthesis